MLAGFYAGARCKRRCVVLEECCELAAFFACSINYADESLSVIVRRAVESGGFIHLSFLKRVAESDLSDGFSSVWSMAAEEAGLPLDAQSIALLKKFGASLGKTDSGDQLELCRFYQERFGQCAKLAREKSAEQIKLCRVTGAAVGVLLFVFLSGG